MIYPPMRMMLSMLFMCVILAGGCHNDASDARGPMYKGQDSTAQYRRVHSPTYNPDSYMRNSSRQPSYEGVTFQTRPDQLGQNYEVNSVEDVPEFDQGNAESPNDN